MSNSLAHVLAGVDHAKGHIHKFEELAGAYIKSEPCKVVVEHGFNPAQKIHKIKLVKPIPDELSFVAFDAIVNLRSCLDHAGFAAAKASGKTGAHAHFPFGPEAIVSNRWASGEGRSTDIPREIFDLMLRFKPYEGGDDLLWALNGLCNGSKHEIVSPMAFGGFTNGDFYFPDEVYECNVGSIWNSAKNELVFARTPVDARYRYNLNITAYVAIGNAIESVRGKEASGLLNALASKVEGIVLAIEAEALRIGLFR